MKITAEVENNLGNAYIVASEGKQAAITSGSWAILLSDAEKYIDPEILDFSRQRENNKEKVDYRVLNARDFSGDRFLPSAGKDLEPIVVSNHSGGATAVDYSRIEELLSTHAYAFEGEDLTELLAAGKAEPVYGNATTSMKRLISGGGQASSYTFRVGGKIVSVDGGLLRGMVQAGFQVVLNTQFCPTEAPTSLPALGLLDTEDRGVVGLLMPLNSCGVLCDKQGRNLHVDASTLCWISPAHAEELIKGDTSFYDPQVASIANDLTLEERIKSRRYGDAIKGIGALRWHGASDEEIDKIVNYASYDAWCSLYHQAIGSASVLLDQVDIFSQDTKELTTSEVRRIRGFSSRTKQICTRIEALSALMKSSGGDEDLGVGPLPELVGLVTDLEELCDL
jgi:hypothetical protein